MRKTVKTLVCFLLMLSLTLGLIGCAKVVSVTKEDVLVNIVDEHYKHMYMQPIHTGKVTTFITHPAQYKITVEYSGKQFVIDDKDTYDKYKDRVGEVITGTLETTTYDNGKKWYDIVSLQ